MITPHLNSWVSLNLWFFQLALSGGKMNKLNKILPSTIITESVAGIGTERKIPFFRSANGIFKRRVALVSVFETKRTVEQTPTINLR